MIISSLLNPADISGYLPESEVKKSEEFAEILKELDGFLDSVKKTDEEKAEEAKAAMEAQERRTKISELYALIAQLRQKLSSGGYDKNTAAQLSMAQTELFWLLGGV